MNLRVKIKKLICTRNFWMSIFFFTGVPDRSVPPAVCCPLSWQASEYLGLCSHSSHSFWHYCGLLCGHSASWFCHSEWKVERTWEASGAQSWHGLVALLKAPELFRGAAVVVGTCYLCLEPGTGLDFCWVADQHSMLGLCYRACRTEDAEKELQSGSL